MAKWVVLDNSYRDHKGWGLGRFGPFDSREEAVHFMDFYFAGRYEPIYDADSLHYPDYPDDEDSYSFNVNGEGVFLCVEQQAEDASPSSVGVW